LQWMRRRNDFTMKGSGFRKINVKSLIVSKRSKIRTEKSTKKSVRMPSLN
jgi:hypothetical protein